MTAELSGPLPNSIHGFDLANERAITKGHTVRLAGGGIMLSLVICVIVSVSAEEPGRLATLSRCIQKGMLKAPDGPDQWSRRPGLVKMEAITLTLIPLAVERIYQLLNGISGALASDVNPSVDSPSSGAKPHNDVESDDNLRGQRLRS